MHGAEQLSGLSKALHAQNGGGQSFTFYAEYAAFIMGHYLEEKKNLLITP